MVRVTSSQCFDDEVGAEFLGVAAKGLTVRTAVKVAGVRVSIALGFVLALALAPHSQIAITAIRANHSFSLEPPK